MNYDLNGKRALVCGSSRGIGRGCAQELANLGASVTLVSRSEDSLREAMSTLSTTAGQSHDILSADFNNLDAVQNAVSGYAQKTGPIHILVNNTGGPPHGPIVDAPREDFLKGFSNHVLCNQLISQTLLPGMKEAGYGRIINIISTSVLLPIRGLGVSNTTRGAVANWARTWSAELAPFGITVNNVLPGFTDTARLSSLFEAKATKAGTDVADVRAKIIASIPMERLGEPGEIGAVVAFLASPAAAYVTGVNLPVDGGRTAVQ